MKPYKLRLPLPVIVSFAALIGILSFIAVSCDKENLPPVAAFTIEPATGNTETIFMFDASGTSDPDDDTEDLLVIWDWEGDDHFDTQYATRKKADHKYAKPGTYLVTLVAKDVRGNTDTLRLELTVASANLPPEEPAQPDPSDGQTDVRIAKRCKWVCVDPDNDYILYTVYFGTTNPPPSVLTAYSFTSFDPGRLQYNTTYYWKVVARDAKGNSTPGPVWSFTTLNLNFGTLDDARDGKRYQTIQIGDRWWMAENLNWEATEGSYCYNDDPAKCTLYGRLYTWQSAMKACPDGWHLPSKQEFEQMVEVAGGVDLAGGALKDYESGLWKTPNQGASNRTGFTALPAGRRYDAGIYAGTGFYAQYYTVTENNPQEAFNLTLGYDYQSVFIYNYKKVYAISVRCVKD